MLLRKSLSIFLVAVVGFSALAVGPAVAGRALSSATVLVPTSDPNGDTGWD